MRAAPTDPPGWGQEIVKYQEINIKVKLPRYDVTNLLRSLGGIHFAVKLCMDGQAKPCHFEKQVKW